MTCSDPIPAAGIADATLFRTEAYIGGRWRAAEDGATFAVTDPANGRTVGDVSALGHAESAAAVDAAQAAFADWSARLPQERAAILHRWHGLIRAAREDLARLMVLEQGKPLSEARGEIDYAASFVEFYAEEAKRPNIEGVTSHLPNAEVELWLEPVGVVALITPWNFPSAMLTRKAAAALAAGCTVVAKPAEETPGTFLMIAEALAEAGLPGGVLNVIHGAPAQISAQLVAHPAIRKISFTGSTAVGKHLAGLAAAEMKRITLELGGHAPVIVCEDADLDAAVSMAVAAKYRNAGQICISPTRFLVAGRIYREFTDAFAEKARAIQVGPGDDPASTMGPLTSRRRLEAMGRLVEDAEAKGARIVAGGERKGNRGHFFEPTVIADAHKDLEVMNTEPFGPIAAIMPFEAMDDAISEANRLPYGLAAYAFTRSAALARDIGDRVQSGMVGINHFGLSTPETPFGGVKDSGYGSEGGSEGLRPYLTTKLISQI